MERAHPGWFTFLYHLNKAGEAVVCVGGKAAHTHHNPQILKRYIFLLLVGAVLAGCGAPLGPAATATPATYTDPFAYCAAVGTADTPGANYVGPQVPESVARGLQQALNAPETPLDVLENGSFWRCMDGSVYACFVGANLPCEARANTDRTPTQEEIDYCQQNPNSDFIPAVVTGRETVYEWRCLDGAPDIVKQHTQPDAQGFLSDIWYKLGPNR
jgi:hypothetical protein